MRLDQNLLVLIKKKACNHLGCCYQTSLCSVSFHESRIWILRIINIASIQPCIFYENIPDSRDRAISPYILITFSRFPPGFRFSEVVRYHSVHHRMSVVCF